MRSGTTFVIENARLVNPGVSSGSGSVLVRDGRIAAVNPASVPAEAQRVDAGGRLVTPGLVDMHTHGLGRFLYEHPEDMADASRLAAARGATCVYPTVVPMPGPGLVKQLAALSAACDDVPGARLAGLHVEGPFMALSGAACPKLPGDVKLLDELIAACAGRLAIMSVSPDTPNILPVIERLVERGIVPFVTHTQATAEQAQAAIEAGARHATHFYDVFYSPPEQDPGVRPMGLIEAWMADGRTTVDFIADGCHVPPLVIRAWTKALGWERVMLITDSNIGAGLPPGVYDTPWGFPVRVKDGDGARIAAGPKEGVLAGSALTMDTGMANLLKWLPDLAPERVWAMGTLNPARLMKRDRTGRLEAGADADLVMWNDDMRAQQVWVAGACVHDAGN